MKRVIWTVTVFLGVSAGCEMPRGIGPATRPAAAADPPTRAAATSKPVADGKPAILEPSQGRPIILRPGDRFYFLLQLAGAFDREIVVSLVHSQTPELYHTITTAEQVQVEAGRHASMVFQIPPDVQEGLYDLRVHGNGYTLTAARSIKVIPEYKTRFRFVHLSDMHIGDPTAPDFDPRLVEEVNLLAPEFIIATGSFIDPVAAGGGEAAWRATLDFFSRFNSPVYILCGQLDDETSYSPAVAASPIGAFSYGDYQALLLFNTPRKGVDAGQVEFVRRELAEYRDRTMSIVASSDDNPAVLAKLAQNDPVADFIRTNRIRLLLCGGSSDWDGREYAGELAKLPGLHYVRTHPASTCRTGLASGVSHYRVVEVNGEDLSYVCPQDDSADRAQPSIACGSIGITGIPAGGELPASATVRIRNGLNQPFSNCNIWVRLRKNGTTRPAVAGGTLKQLYDGRTYWLCRIAVDLPDRGGLQIAASAEGQVPAPLPVSVEFSGPEELAFAPAKTEAGMGYYTCDEKLTITLRNRAAEPITLRPIIRLHGTALPIATPSDVAWPVTIAPSQSVAVPLRLVLPGVVEGRRYLQVSFVEDPLKRLYMRRVEIRKTGATTQSRP